MPDRRVLKAVSVVQREIAQGGDASVRHLAVTAGLSPSRLRHLFKAERGISLREYTRGLRLQMACRLLETTSLSVKEIAGAVGYSQSPPFVRRFAKAFGTTPRSYRARSGRSGEES
jgi:AraC family transcriptional regulator, arabinose operon regulatory protein